MSTKFKISLLGILIMSSCVSHKLPDLQLGRKNLKQHVKLEKLTNGLSFYNIVRGESSKFDFFTLSTGVLSKQKENKIFNLLKQLGYKPRIETTPELGPHQEFIGNLIQIGKFKTRKEAQVIKKILNEKGIEMALRYSAEDGKETTGPFQISIFKFDPKKFKGQLLTALGHNKIKQTEYTSEIAKRHHAIAAINAGFFAWKKTVGIVGEPAGISVIDGQLVSEASNGRSALVINHDSIFVAQDVKTKITLNLNDSLFSIHGINRSPSKALNCGNQINSTQSTLPIHDFVCNNQNEIILFNSSFGKTSDLGKGIEFIIDSKGLIKSVILFRGNKIPKNGYTLQAIGLEAQRLRKTIKKGMTININTKLFSKKTEIPLKKGLYVTNGGPTLIKNGLPFSAKRHLEGFETQFSNIKISDKFVDKKDNTSINKDNINNRNGFYHGWVLRRHPRTAFGITKDQIIYGVVVYGRQPGISAGASITEMEKLMAQLGCHNAINLDGGGSSMMLINGQKTGKSSDKEGERAVGDAIIITH